jgi:hypothetical protein
MSSTAMTGVFEKAWSSSCEAQSQSFRGKVHRLARRSYEITLAAGMAVLEAREQFFPATC